MTAENGDQAAFINYCLVTLATAISFGFQILALNVNMGSCMCTFFPGSK